MKNMIKIDNLESKKTWLYRGAIALIFTVAIAFRVHYLGEKEGFHGDETWSVVLSNYGKIGWTERIHAGSYSGAELKEILLNTDPSLKEAIKDVGHLWQDNRDAPHTNFYYSLLRLSFVGLEYRSVDGIVERAGTLNLILFSITFFLFLSLLGKIFSDRRVILLALFVAFVNVGEVSNTLFFRPYMLQTLFFVWATSVIISINEKIKNGEYNTTWQNMVSFSLVLGFLLLSGYYAIVYAFFLGLTLLFNLYRYKQLDKIYYFIASIIIAISFDFLLYPKYYQFITHKYATEILHDVGVANIFTIAWRFIYMFIQIVVGKLSYPCIAIIILAMILGVTQRSRFVTFRKTFKYVFIAVVSSIFILFLSAGMSQRYMSPMYAIITLFIPLVYDGIRRNILRDLLIVALCITTLISVYNEKNIMYLYKEKSIVAKGIMTPVYIYYEKNYSIVSLLTTLDDEQNYIVCETLEDFKYLATISEECYAIHGSEHGTEGVIDGWESNVLIMNQTQCNIYQLKSNKN